MIGEIYKYGLTNGDLHLSNFDDRQLGFTNIVQKYLGEKNIDTDYRLLDFEKSIKGLANIDDKINMIIGYYKPKTESRYDDEKRVVSILNEIAKFMFDFYTYHKTMFKLNEKYQISTSKIR